MELNVEVIELFFNYQSFVFVSLVKLSVRYCTTRQKQD